MQSLKGFYHDSIFDTNFNISFIDQFFVWIFLRQFHIKGQLVHSSFLVAIFIQNLLDNFRIDFMLQNLQIKLSVDL